MHRAKSPPFVEKGRAFFEVVWSQWVVFYKTVKKYYLFCINVAVTNRICSGL